jgi:uncharacterized protein YndB with AHSA1/START domain
MKALIFRVDLPALRDVVWDLWTTREGLGSWLCDRSADVSPVVGGAFDPRWSPEAAWPGRRGVSGGRVLSVDPPRLLVVSWPLTQLGSEGLPRAVRGTTEVQVELRPTLEGTTLLLGHAGWGSGSAWEWVRHLTERAWGGALERLLMVVRGREGPAPHRGEQISLPFD